MRIQLSLLIILLYTCTPVSFAMEAGQPSEEKGGEEVEELVTLGQKGKRKPERQEPEGVEKTLKKPEIRSIVIKKLIMPEYVLNEQTKEYEKQDVLGGKVIINDENSPELFTATTFEDHIKDKSKEGLAYIIAQVTTEVGGVKRKDYFDAYQLMTYMFGSDFTQSAKNRYKDQPNTFKSHPVSKLPIIGSIDFYWVKSIDDPIFKYLGSDYGLHATSDSNIKVFLIDFFEANKSTDLIGPDNEALMSRTSHQFELAINYYKGGKYDDAEFYFKLITKFDIPEQDPYMLELKDKATMYLGLIAYRKKQYDMALSYLVPLVNNQETDIADTAKLYIGLIYYNQKKFDEALKYLEEAVYKIKSIQAAAGSLEQPKIEKEINPQSPALIPIAKIYIEQGKYDKALEYLKKIEKPSEDVVALITEAQQKMQK